MRPRTKLILILLTVAVAVGWPVIAHHRLKGKVAEYRRQLIAQGEKMSVAELAPLLPAAADNGADDLVSAAWQAGSINYSNQPPTMRMLVPGRALVAWRQPILASSDTTNVWPALREDLEARSEALAEMREALAKPALAFPLDYSQGFMLLLPHLSPLKQTAQWLSAATMFQLREHQPSAAIENLRALTALVCNYKDEPVLISCLVRLAITSIAVGTAWELLQSQDLNENKLAALQTQWEMASVSDHAEAALMMERVMLADIFAKGRNSPRLLTALGGGTTSWWSELTELGQGVLNNPKEGLEELIRRYPGYLAWKWWWSYEDELVEMQLMQASLVALREARSEQCFARALGRCEQTHEQIEEAHPKAGSWFHLGTGAMTKTFVTRLRTAEIQRHLLLTAIALKRFHLRHGRYPDSLAALVPEFCKETPRDPVDGQPLRYRRQADGSFLLYSVGENGVDDGGDPSPTTASRSPRIWTRWRDAVWPQPAGPEEVLLYELEVEAEREKEQMRARVIVTNGLTPAVLVEMERLAQTYHFTLTNNPARHP